MTNIDEYQPGWHPRKTIHRSSVALQRPQEKHALVAFGTNQPFGDISPKEVISSAAGMLAARLDAESRLSGLYRTPCFPAGAGPDYVNACALMTLRHSLMPDIILSSLHEIEARFGRQRGARWAARTLDIDLLALGDTVLPDEATQDFWRDLPPERQAREAPDRLILPHPRLQDRAFVLVPLADVAPGWHHPRLGLTVAQMLERLPAGDRAAVIRLDGGASS